MKMVEVVLGLAFVYLLLSLLCTSAAELIAAMRRLRARTLEEGIYNLLQSGRHTRRHIQARRKTRRDGQSSPACMADRFFDHPLIDGLTDLDRCDASYIPSHLFARVVLDLVASHWCPRKTEAPALPAEQTADAKPAPAALPAGPEEVLGEGDPAAVAAGAGGAAAPAPDVLEVIRTALRDRASSADQEPTDASEEAARIEVKLATALRALLMNASDLAAAEANIQKWYDDGMDRVTGWYKRKAQVIVLIVAVFISVSMNADSINIAERLWTDDVLRAAVVAAATEEAANPRHDALSGAAQSRGEGRGAAADSQDGGPPGAEQGLIKEVQGRLGKQGKTARPEGEQNAAAERAGAGEVEDAIPTAPDPGVTAIENIAYLQQRLTDFHLPLGWGAGSRPTRKDIQWGNKDDWMVFKQFTGFWGRRLVGWLLTAIALSLGAPFWFDLLKRLVNVRASGVDPDVKAKKKREDAVAVGDGNG
jgi:hypothetical protein